MKLCHAAALALVGWYLMQPPMYLPNHKLDTTAPLSQWIVNSAFDSAFECNETLAYVSHHAAHGTADPKLRAAVKQRAEASMCISTDDPRLKGN